MVLAALFLLSACSTDAAAPVMPVVEALMATAALPDVGANLQKGSCSSGPGNEGADSYFIGSFTVKGSAVTGTEKWQLYTNPKWAAKGGKDCSIEWTMTGTTTGPGACGDCDLGIKVHAVPDITGSDCPEDLVIGHRMPDGRRAGGEGVEFDVQYSIKKRADGTAQVFFAKSGKLLGEGYHQGDSFNYVSMHQCKWF